MLIHFYKRGFDEMVIEIIAEELTSSVNANNFEDYYGNTGTLTLRYTGDNSTLSVGLYSTGLNTFEGVVALEDLPFGLYQLQGKVEDVVGNAAVITDYYLPTDLPVQPVELLIEVGYNLVPVISIDGKYDNDIMVKAKYAYIISFTAPELSKLYEINIRGKYEQEIDTECQ